YGFVDDSFLFIKSQQLIISIGNSRNQIAFDGLMSSNRSKISGPLCAFLSSQFSPYINFPIHTSGNIKLMNITSRTNDLPELCVQRLRTEGIIRSNVYGG